MILGITGSIGSGKTNTAKLFRKYGFRVISADKAGHEIIKKNSAAYKKIVKIFGNEILDKNKSIDRKKLGDIVFNDTGKLKKLNLVTHLRIIKEIKNQIKKIKSKHGNKTNIMVDAPLLLETMAKNLVDKIIVVKCDKEKIIKRLSKKYPKEKIERILNAQMPLIEKVKYADFVIDNNKDIAYLKKQVAEIVEKISHRKKRER